MKQVLAGMLLFAAATLFVSCSKKQDNAEEVTEIWVLERYEADRIIYKTATALETDKPGYIFYSNGNLTERQVPGWCATPPVVYENYNGQWQFAGNIYNISGAYWGGTHSYRLEVISRNGSEIVTKRL